MRVIGKYFYDGDGKRVKKVVPGGETTVFVYDAGGKLIGEYSTEVQTGSSAKTVYTTNDHLGSPRINTDATGQVISRHDYHPFGEEIPRTGYGSDTIRKQFTGYERDGETGLDFAEARTYASSYGRFTVPDPLLSSGNPSSPQTWNRFIYVRNNPLRSTDPIGLYECTSTSKAECQAFRQKLADDRKKLGDIEAKYTQNSDEYRKAKSALDSYGCESKGGRCVDENGNAKVVGKDEKGKPLYESDTASNVKVSFGWDGAANTSIRRGEKNIYVSFGAGYAQNPGIIGNEGTDINAFQNYFNTGQNSLKYQTEFDGLFVQAVYSELNASANGNDFAYFFVDNAGSAPPYNVNHWEKGWETPDHQTVRAKRADAINDVLKNSKLYQLSPGGGQRIVGN